MVPSILQSDILKSDILTVSMLEGEDMAQATSGSSQQINVDEDPATACPDAVAHDSSSGVPLYPPSFDNSVDKQDSTTLNDTAPDVCVSICEVRRVMTLNMTQIVSKMRRIDHGVPDRDRLTKL